MDYIHWFSRKAKANYELKPEDYDFARQGGVVRLLHKSGQYVGYVVPRKGGVVPSMKE